MNFFEHQDRARRSTSLLVLLFLTGLLLLIGLTAALLLLLVNDGELPGVHRPFYPSDWRLVIQVALGVLLVVVLGSLFRHLQLAAGGRVVAESLGGRLIQPDTLDPKERQLLNLVEEMAIASGMPVPPVYLLQDAAINAFAAGYSLQDAVIGVTQGALDQLNREELQGVIAHEFSHIHNGDMRLNLRLVALLHGILVIALAGRLLLHATGRSSRRSRDDKGRGALLLLAIGLMILGYVGLLFGKLIKAAVNRQREFLADASAVQFTRNPDGIAGALQKIAGYPAPSQLHADQAEDFSHLFFSNALTASFTSLLATHPPLEARIQRLQPGQKSRQARQASSSSAPAGLHQGFAGQATHTAANLQQVVEDWQEPSPQQLQQAQAQLQGIPAPLRDAAHEAWSARAVIYGLLLDEAPGMREKQLEGLAQQALPDTFRHLQQLLPAFAALPAASRLALAETCIPALKQMTLEQTTRFNQCLQWLIRADQRISLNEWCLVRLLQYHLRETDRHRENRKLADSTLALSQLLSLMVHAGQVETQAAGQAFNAACRELGRDDLQLLPRDALNYKLLDQALQELLQLKPLQKPRLLKALARCIETPGQLHQQQLDLFHLMGAALNCPLPPLAVST